MNSDQQQQLKLLTSSFSSAGESLPSSFWLRYITKPKSFLCVYKSAMKKNENFMYLSIYEHTFVLHKYLYVYIIHCEGREEPKPVCSRLRISSSPLKQLKKLLLPLEKIPKRNILIYIYLYISLSFIKVSLQHATAAAAAAAAATVTVATARVSALWQ